MRTYELYSAFEGTTVDPEPNFVKAVVEPGAVVGESSPNCFRASSLRLTEAILTLLRLRMKPVEEAPTTSGRRSGRQAPTMPIEDSTMAQYTRGEFISTGTDQTRDECLTRDCLQLKSKNPTFSSACH